MKVLFLTLSNITSLTDYGLYPDLLREFKKNGHQVFVACPVEKRFKKNTHILRDEVGSILKVKTGNIQKTGLIEKGISTLKLQGQFIRAIKKRFKDERFDLILYATPPITFAKVIKYFKKRDNARTYLLLKDIFPQNSIDLGILSTRGVKGLIYRFFRKKEKQLYAISDYIGCMSQANCEFLLKNNSFIDKDKVEICPNCIDVRDLSLTQEEKREMRLKYGLPLDKKLFIYGGNLGKPQDVPFLIECVKKCCDLEDVFFVVAGSGTDRHYLEEFVKKENPTNLMLFDYIPKMEYDKMVACCDIGLLFLDRRFTIPNFPSRLLVYMQAGLPVLSCTDTNTDVGSIIVNGGFGWSCVSDDAEIFKQKVLQAKDTVGLEMIEREKEYLINNYSATLGYDVIIKRF